MTSSLRAVAASSLALLVVACGGGGGGGETVDTSPPAPPVLSGTTPASPSSDARPRLSGTAEAGATVRIFTNASCTAPAAVTATATATGAFSASVTAVANGTTTLAATATDAAGNTSACSSAVTYRHDGLAPSPPDLQRLAPLPPSPTATPHLFGVAEPGATLRVHALEACGGLVVATAIVNPDGHFELELQAPPNASTTFTATATDPVGNVSPCSNALAYLHDDLPPAPPAGLAFAPASPSASTEPLLSGTLEAGAALLLFDSGDCTGTPAVSQPGAAFSFGVPVAADATRTLSLAARDAAGNRSTCAGPLTYVNDSRPPAAPALSAIAPASPSANPSPLLSGTAEAGATLRIHAQAACAGPAVVTAIVPAGGAFELQVPATSNATTTYTATATDAAGNGSACSGGLDYLHDDLPPIPPVLLATSPASPSSALGFTLRGVAEPSARVAVYGQADCTGPALETTVADPAGAFATGPLTAPPNAAVQLAAVATDAAGNASACSSPLEFRHDDVAPAPPVVLSTSPPGGYNQNVPFVLGVGEPGARVTLHTTPDCAGGEAGSGAADASGSFSVTVTVADNTTTTFWATQVDLAGNGSGCSTSSVTYVEESRTLLVLPGNVVLDAAPSALSQQQFGYTLTGGPDTGVTWSVREADGGTITPDGLYTAPTRPGTYEVLATTRGPLPALTRWANVVVRHPELQGSVTWAGPAAGRIFVAVTGPFGGPPVGGTSFAVPGPGSYPFTVRGITSTGPHRISAWLDRTGVEKYVAGADPYGEVNVDLTGQTLTAPPIALAEPLPLPPPTPSVGAAMPGDGMAVVPFDAPRDAQGRELAAAYHVECTTGAPPATPSYGAVHIPGGHDRVAFVYGLTNGLATACSVWTERGGVLSPPAVTPPFVPGPGSGGFTVSGTLAWSGAPPNGPLFAVLFDPTAQQAWFQRYDAPVFPLDFQISHVPAGNYGLGFIVDADADGRLGPADLNTLSSALVEPVAVAGDVAGLAASVTWPDASLHAVVGRNVWEGGGEQYDLVLLARSGARLPVTVVAFAGPDLRVPVDLGVSDQAGGNAVGFTTLRSLGATPPVPGTYQAFADHGDGSGTVLTAEVTAASLLDPPVPLSPVRGADAPPRPTLSWAEPALPPPGPYAYRLSLSTSTGGWIWDTDSFPPASACAAGVCQAAFDFDGRAAMASLPPGDYRWSVQLQSAALDVARAEASFHVPVEVSVTPSGASLAPGASRPFRATVTGPGSVTWSASCGVITPRADPLLADYVAPVDGLCTVTATSTQEPTRSASATVSVLPIPLEVVPAFPAVAPGQVQYFSATVGGPGSVTWEASCGTLAATSDPLVVRWTAPFGVPSCSVRAVSTVQPGTFFNNYVAIVGSGSYALDPPVAVLNPGQSQPFVLRQGALARPADFTVPEQGGGTVDAAGVYTAPGAPGIYHVVAAPQGDPGWSATSVVMVVSAATSPQVSVQLTPAAGSAVILGAVPLLATVSGCPDPAVSWRVVEVGGGQVNPTGPGAADYVAPPYPGTFHVQAVAACDPTKAAQATVTVGLPTVSGTLVDPVGGTGRIYLVLVTPWNEVVAGTSLTAPGPFTLRGVRQPGSYTLWAWRDTLGTSKPAPAFEPSAVIPVTVPVGGSFSAADVTLAAPPPPAAPAALAAPMVFTGDGTAVVFLQPLRDPVTGFETVDHYDLGCDTVPPSGTPRTFAVTLADVKVVVLDGPPGSTWSCDAWGSAAGLDGPTVSTGPFTLSAAAGGHAVSGDVALAGPSPGGRLFVALYSEALGLVPQLIASPSFPQPFALTGVADGAWQAGAILDVNGDGIIQRTEPNLFNGAAPPVTVAGADVSGLALTLPLDDASVLVGTRRWDGEFQTGYGLMLMVRSGRRVPVAAVLTGGPGLSGPVDLGMRLWDGSDTVEFGTSLELGTTRPAVGATYRVTVTWADGTSSELAGQVARVLDPPVPLGPIDPLAVPIAEPAFPTFSWAAPAVLPAAPYEYSVYMTDGTGWSRYGIPPGQTSIVFGDGQPATPGLAAGVHRWVVSIRDRDGNEASRESVFTVSP